MDLLQRNREPRQPLKSATTTFFVMAALIGLAASNAIIGVIAGLVIAVVVFAVLRAIAQSGRA